MNKNKIISANRREPFSMREERPSTLRRRRTSRSAPVPIPNKDNMLRTKDGRYYSHKEADLHSVLSSSPPGVGGLVLPEDKRDTEILGAKPKKIDRRQRSRSLSERKEIDEELRQELVSRLVEEAKALGLTEYFNALNTVLEPHDK